MEIWGKMREVELLPTRDCESGYALLSFKNMLDNAYL